MSDKRMLSMRLNPTITSLATPVLLLAALWLALVCAGCSHPPASRGVVRDAQGRIVLNYWNGFTGPDGTTMTAMVAQFQRDNPDIRVKMQLIPWGTYYNKLTLALAYGGAPDVFICQAHRMPEFASFGTLRPLKDLFDSAQPPLRASQFAPAPWKASFYDGVQYALPLDVHPMGMYYNVKLFKDAGIVDAQGNAKPPRTWEEFLTDAKKLTKDTTGRGRPDQWGFVITNQETIFLAMTHQFGGSILTPDGKHGNLSSPACLAAVGRMHDLIYKYHVAPPPEGIDSWLALRQGKVAMGLEGIYMLSSLQEQKSQDFAGAPIPQFGPEPATWGGSHLLCQPRGLSPEQSNAAWRLMRYLSDHSLTWAEGGQVPARADIERSPQFQALPVQAQFAREISYVHYAPLVPSDNSLFQFVDPAVEAVLLNLQTPEAAMRDADRRINQMLERGR